MRILPTASELVSLALAETDFLSEIRGDVAHIRGHAADAIERAAEEWTDANDLPVPSDLLNFATDLLIEAGWERLEAAEAEAEAIRLDAIYAGTLVVD
jgi:hypothetical protein